MKWARFLLPPLLVMALIATSLFVGLSRPGASKSLTLKLLSSETVRTDLASSLIDQLVDSDNLLLKALLTSNRDKAEQTIAASLATEQEKQEISDAVESLTNALFTGQSSVQLDPTPIYRPIYDALDAIFPALKLGETNLQDIEPVTLGSDTPLPNLRWVRTLLAASLILWPLLLLLAFLYVRHNGRNGRRTLALQTLVVAGISAVLTFGAPMLARAAGSDPLQQVLIGAAIGQLGLAALWISLLLVVLSTVVLLTNRQTNFQSAKFESAKSESVGEGVLPSQGSTQSE